MKIAKETGMALTNKRINRNTCALTQPLTGIGLLFSDPSTVTCEELQQHKNFLKVSKKQEKDLKDMEKKFQKKREELIQKYSDQFKALKKKNTAKK